MYLGKTDSDLLLDPNFLSKVKSEEGLYPLPLSNIDWIVTAMRITVFGWSLLLLTSQMKVQSKPVVKHVKVVANLVSYL
jgi:hypothetical protein